MGSVKTSLYAYCVARLDMDEPWSVFPGIADKSVFAVRDQKVAMLVSRLEKVKLDETRHVLQHGQVINKVFGERTVLPFRYGTTFNSEEEIRALLLRNREQFVEGLRLLRGKSEVHLKLSFRLKAPAPLRVMSAAGGADSMGRLTVSPQGYAIAAPAPLAEVAQKQIDHVIECIKQAFQPIQELISVRHAERGQVHMEIRCLVQETHVETCKKFALTGFDQLEDRQLQITGPWPPCHFLPVSAKLPTRTDRLGPLPGRLPLRSRLARV
jgi:hypothetical protein